MPEHPLSRSIQEILSQVYYIDINISMKLLDRLMVFRHDRRQNFNSHLHAIVFDGFFMDDDSFQTG